MSKINLDLKAFKHVSSDGETTTLEHIKDGHTITLKHAKLDKAAAKALAGLAPKDKEVTEDGQGPVMMKDGGYVPREAASGSYDPQNQRDAPKKEMTQGERKRKVKEGAEAGNSTTLGDMWDNAKKAVGYAEGGDVEAASAPPPVAEATPDLGLVPDYVQTPIEQIALPKGPFNEPEPPGMLQNQLHAMGIGDELSPKVMDTVESVATKAAYPGMSMPQANAEGQATADAIQPAEAQLAPNTPMGQAAADKPIAQGPSPEESFMGGVNKMQRGIQMAADAQGNLGNQQAALYEQRAGMLQEMSAKYKEDYDALNQERLAHIQDIKAGHINPDKYWDNHSKVAAGIGMILAGFNPTNSPNAAINFLKFQMEQNLQSQMKNLDSDQNLLRANLQQFGNMKDATDMTRVMQMDMVASQLQAAAAKAQGPLAKAAALQASGKLEAESSQLAGQLAAKKAMATLQAQAVSDPKKLPAFIAALEQTDPKRAADLRERFIPGIGLANTGKDATDLKEMKGGVDAAKDGIRQLVDMSKKPFKSLSLQDRAKAQTLQQTLVGALRLPITGPGAMNEGERKMLENIIADPTSVFSLDATNRKRLETLMQTLDQKFMATAASRGVQLPQGWNTGHLNEQQKQFAAWAQKNPNDPRAKAVMQKLGLGN